MAQRRPAANGGRRRSEETTTTAAATEGTTRCCYYDPGISTTQAWLDSIEVATRVLTAARRRGRRADDRSGGGSGNFGRGGGGGGRRGNNNRNSGNGNNSRPTEEEFAGSLRHLRRLEERLERHFDRWDDGPPKIAPPKFVRGGGGKNNKKNGGAGVGDRRPRRRQQRNSDGDDDDREDGGGGEEKTNARENYGDSSRRDSNRFAYFGQDDESDGGEDESEEEQEVVPLEYAEHATATAADPGPVGAGSAPYLTMRRIAIRVVTAQSELYSGQARAPEWRQGAHLYQTSLTKIRHALNLADSECAKLLAAGVVPVALQEDADIVSVAVANLVDKQEDFTRKAKSKERYLVKKLEPAWQNRDAARERMGEDRWVNNPSPKRRQWNDRKDDELLLREVRDAIRVLDDMDTDGVVKGSRDLRNQVRGEGSDRWNGNRPADLANRVPLEDYPDPTEFGWVFTGSAWGGIEFFETVEGQIRLDWYFESAEIKLSADDGVGGQIVAGPHEVTPEQYLEVLVNPYQLYVPSHHDDTGAAMMMAPGAVGGAYHDPHQQ